MGKGSAKKKSGATKGRDKRSRNAAPAPDRRIEKLQAELDKALRREAKAASRLEAAQAEVVALRAALARIMAPPSEPEPSAETSTELRAAAPKPAVTKPAAPKPAATRRRVTPAPVAAATPPTPAATPPTPAAAPPARRPATRRAPAPPDPAPAPAAEPPVPAPAPRPRRSPRRPAQPGADS